MGRVEGGWNKDVLGVKKIEKLAIGGEGTIIRDSRVLLDNFIHPCLIKTC